MSHYRLDKLTELEGMIKLRIKNKLDYAVNTLYDGREYHSDGEYLQKMNELKSLSEFVDLIEKSDNN